MESKRSIYEHHLEDAFYGIKVREIDRFKAAKLKTHAAKTVNNMLTVLRNALDVATRWEIIEAVPGIAWVKTEKPRFRFLDFHEAARLVEAARQEPLVHAIIVTALNTGLRLGELLALKWDAVDVKAGRLHVREAVASGVVGTPKSGRAHARPRSAAERYGAGRAQGPPAPTRPAGVLQRRPVHAHQERSQGSAAAGTGTGGHHRAALARPAPYVRLAPRDARRPAKAVQELLGHATIEMTMRYAHLSPNVARDAVRALDVGGDTGGDSVAAE